ncbi:hypothetical protein ABW19_dt0206931 [Dactylella cylindrospora]|nr:hypothetical protein ABW19_dt0206931 [Dactylella cylindrospora]
MSGNYKAHLRESYHPSNPLTFDFWQPQLKHPLNDINNRPVRETGTRYVKSPSFNETSADLNAAAGILRDLHNSLEPKDKLCPPTPGTIEEYVTGKKAPNFCKDGWSLAPIGELQFAEEKVLCKSVYYMAMETFEKFQSGHYASDDLQPPEPAGYAVKVDGGKDWAWRVYVWRNTNGC